MAADAPSAVLDRRFRQPCDRYTHQAAVRTSLTARFRSRSSPLVGGTLMRSWSSVRATALLASLVALFGAPATASAQGSANVQGTITDSIGRRPIGGVQVVVVGTTRG